jgi:hypothetical protein
VQSQYYYGVGVVLARKGSPDELLRQARQQAVADLAESITVDVRSKVTQVSSRVDAGRKSTKKIEFSAIAETSTELTLKNVELDDQWLDRGGCLLWARVRIKKDVAERAASEAYFRRVLQQVDELTARALDPSTDASTRAAAADEARWLVEGVDFSILKEGPPKQVLLSRIDKAQGAAREGLTSKAETEVAIRKALEFGEQARTAVNPYEKALASNEVVRLLRSVLRQNPGGVPGVASGAELSFRLAEAEFDRGNACEAKRALDNSLDPALNGTAADRNRANKRLEQIRCGPEEQRRGLWAAMFAGRRVGVLCFTQVSGADTPAIWRKGCDVVSNGLASLGARVIVLADSKISFGDLGLSGGAGRKLDFGGAEPDLVVAIGAEGALTGRANAEASSGREYQYSGRVGTVVRQRDVTLYSDVFDAITGWNPISPQMTLDVLAVNLGKRWDDRFSIYLAQQSRESVIAR